MGKLLERLQQRKILVSDGAWGTYLYEKGLEVGQCPELWNDTHSDDVYDIAKSYVDAGADMILTNSFGGSPIKLALYGLAERAEELNLKAAEISRKAAGDDCLVLGSIGPTGEILMMGNVTEEQLYQGFLLQAEALKKGGVDALIVETMSAVDEAVLAVRAAVSTGLETVCTFTFNKTSAIEYKTMMGTGIPEMTAALKEAGACVIGSNCGNGFDQMVDIVAQIRSIDASIPVLVHANAGLPVIKDGETVYPETADVVAGKIDALLNSGANIVGGCCGTTPEHIRRIVEEVRKHK